MCQKVCGVCRIFALANQPIIMESTHSNELITDQIFLFSFVISIFHFRAHFLARPHDSYKYLFWIPVTTCITRKNIQCK